MVELLFTDILFFAIPVILLAFLGISIYRYASARKKNAKEPDTFSQSELCARKLVLIIAAVLAGVFLVIVMGFAALMFLAVAFM